jgi:hypothetical protein
MMMAKLPAFVGCALALVALTGCAQPRACYETVEHPEYGRTLQEIPCPAEEEQ